MISARSTTLSHAISVPETRQAQRKLIKRRDAGAAAFDDSLHPLLARLYAARGLTCADQARTGLDALLPPVLKDIDRAAGLLADAMAAQQRLLIVGDFDADGATSTALGMLALRAMGAMQVDFLVPNRFDYGYGLTPEIVDVARTRDPDLIITVDNGIASFAGIDACNAAGIPVIVTDHHLPADSLPAAAAIVNPNQPGCAFPGKGLAGVGVMFYLLCALRAELQRRDWFAKRGLNPPNLAQYLDLVALGTVADVVPLEPNNRALVAQGLRRIRAGRCRPGIRALLQVAGRDPAQLVATDLGFTVGPRLNAAGRLDDISEGIRCLLTDDEDEALRLAGELDRLNRDRREIEREMQSQAEAVVAGIALDDDGALPPGLCLFDENWHQGVVGLVASRIKERTHRPVIAFALTDDGRLKGSGRSVPGVHLRDMLDLVAKRKPAVLSHFGGHAMAAGLTLERQHLAEFEAQFTAVLRDNVPEHLLQPVLFSDGELPAEQMNLDIAKLLREGGPWGQKFPEPLFEGEFTIVSQRIVGERHLKLVLAHPDNREMLFDAIAFNIDPGLWPNNGLKSVRVVYKLDVNSYRGRESAQLMIEYFDLGDD